MNIDNLVSEMQAEEILGKKGIKNKILAEEDIRNACVLSKRYLGPTSYGLLLENWAKQKFNFNNKIDEISGDARCKDKNIEIKVTLGDSKGGFNFVQIRPHHDIDYYLFLTYCLKKDEVVWLLCPTKELYSLIPKYGGYGHGTIKEKGMITEDSIIDNKKLLYDYALRPNPLRPNPLKETKSKILWDIMLQKFRIQEDEIINIFE